MECEAYVAKLKPCWLRRGLHVAARTDASDRGYCEPIRSVRRAAGADAVLADGLRDLEFIPDLSSRVQKPYVRRSQDGDFPLAIWLKAKEELGTALVIYSTPCLFAAQEANEDAMKSRLDGNGDARAIRGRKTGVQESTAILQENLARRDLPDADHE